MEAALKSVQFLQPARAKENLARLQKQLPPAAQQALPRLLSNLPDPDTALNNMERFAAAAPPKVRDFLAGHPPALHHLLSLFGHSQYLSDTLIRQPDLALWLEQEPTLHRVRTREEMSLSLSSFADEPQQAGAELATLLGRFKRREYLRIALRDVLHLATLSEITLELSGLADAILEYTRQRAQAELEQRYGRPMFEAQGATGSNPAESLMTILSMGKLGGNELNYSSDIDLIFLYRANGETTRGISNKEYFVKLAHRVVGTLTAFSPEGAVFRVDLRLRPQGGEGDLAISLEGARHYYGERARDWELQALAKARQSAGDAALARDFLEYVEPLIYRTTVNFAAMDSVLFARERIRVALERRSSRQLGINLKLERGGIRDIEFLAQCLQRLYGGQQSWLRSGGTLFALQKLAEKGYLRQRDYGPLSRAYVFLRHIEHLLQLERGQQTHRLPASPDALAVLARRARLDQHAGGAGGKASQQAAAEVLVAEVERHMSRVREIYDRLILAHSPATAARREFQLEPDAPFTAGEHGYPELLRYVEGNSPALYQTISELPVRRGRKALQRFVTSAYAGAEEFAFLCQHPGVLEPAAELFEHSPFLSELLVRHPVEISELLELPPAGDAVAPEEQGRFRVEAPYTVQDDPVLMHLANAEAPLAEKMALMRRHYRRNLLRVHAHSLLGPLPVFSTLEATSALAEQALHAAYQAAVKETARTMAHPAGDLIVLALGRLGIREFDIASDADLAFLYRGGDPEAKHFWTRVAERMIEILSAYTGEGTIFAVDTRLRPRGREGELVEAEANFAEYFASAAEPWEAVTYMKSRVVAGDVAEGTVLLTRIQNTIGERFGQGPEAAGKLAEMRKKLEAITTPHTRLKTAPGGYYDIDFILTYLRLQAAQVFFPSLTTLERLRVVEWMGQLRPDQIQTLREGTIFLRGLGHALRVSTGRSDSELPLAGPQADAFVALAERWLLQTLGGRPIAEALEGVTSRVRGVFQEIFG